MIFDDANVRIRLRGDYDGTEDEDEKRQGGRNLSNAFSDFRHILAQPQRVFSSLSQRGVHLVQSRLKVAIINSCLFICISDVLSWLTMILVTEEEMRAN